MDIQKVDSNFVCNSSVLDNVKFYTIPSAFFDLYGVNFDYIHNTFVRMPYDIAFSVSENVGGLNRCTTGGRIRFKTNSSHITIKAKYSHCLFSPNSSPCANMGYVIFNDSLNKYITHIFPSLDQQNEFSISKKVSNGEMFDYTIFLPTYHDTLYSLEIGLDNEAVLTNGKKYKDILPILYYGSSITQGGCTCRADLTYPAIICKNTNIDFINLGFSGNALAQDNMINYLSTIKTSLFVCDYDHNAPSVDYLIKTHYKLYTTYRKANPTTPILFLTRPFSTDNVDMQKRIDVVKNTYDIALKNGDKNVYFIDGSTIFGELHDYCTVDTTHPNTLGMFVMAKLIGNKITDILNLKD